MPSSVTVTSTLPGPSLTVMAAWLAELCLATLASSSAAQKYAMASMAGDGHALVLAVSLTGTALVSARLDSAASRPRSSTGG